MNRSESIVFKAIDLDGQPFEKEVSGLLAVCIQHELDHLDGKLFVDYLSPLKRQLARKKVKKEQKHRIESANKTKSRGVA